MKRVYPIILIPETEGGYTVFVPDLEIGTQGSTVAECIDMARDAIGAWGICEQDAGRTIPEPQTLVPAHEADEIVTLVDIDFVAYRRAQDMRTVRKNVTIPAWLNYAAEEQGVNFSKVLQEALKTTLHLSYSPS